MTGGWCRNAFSHQIQPQIWEVGFIKRVEGIGRTQDDFPGQLLNLLALVIAVIFLEGAACYRFITWKVFWPAATLRLCLQLLLSNKSEEGPEFPSWVLCWDTDPLHRLLQACAAAATTKQAGPVVYELLCRWRWIGGTGLTECTVWSLMSSFLVVPELVSVRREMMRLSVVAKLGNGSELLEIRCYVAAWLSALGLSCWISPAVTSLLKKHYRITRSILCISAF